MKKLFIALVLFVFMTIPTTLYAQKNSVSGAMMIQNTDVIKTKKEINPKLFLLGEAGLMAGSIGVGNDIMLTAGYRFKERFVAGGGLGYFGGYGYQAYVGLILYGYGRVDILKNRKITPYASLYLGGNIPHGIYVSPMIGIRLPISKSIKFNISTGLAIADTFAVEEKTYVNSYWTETHYVYNYRDYTYTSCNWSLRVGIEF